jgi:hypothetical protein
MFDFGIVVVVVLHTRTGVVTGLSTRSLSGIERLVGRRAHSRMRVIRISWADLSQDVGGVWLR